MIRTINLNAGWRMTHRPLRWGPEQAARVQRETEGWFSCDLPCDIHVPLIREGVIPEPLTARHWRDCRWTEDRSWWFTKTFTAGAGVREADRVVLTADGVDCRADFFLNGVPLGRHESAFFPFEKPVGDLLTAGENTLLVRVTGGFENVTDDELAAVGHQVCAEYKSRPLDRGDERRAAVRKPQYTAGWDWGPRLVTCGILGGVRLTAARTLAVSDVYARTESLEPARVAVTVEIENLRPIATIAAAAEVELLLEGRTAVRGSREIVLRSGVNYADFTLEVPDPALWWPGGSGGQPLYTARASVTAEGAADMRETVFGLRTVELDMTPLEGGERLFAFRINGRRIFMKGGNWIPADAVYGRVTGEKYAALLREAAGAHFNMLRVWGGGIYEKDIFYRLCDELGILVWQDFMFACSLYPDHDPDFVELCRREMIHQIRRLRGHACLALWSGNNENQQIFPENWTGDPEGVQGGITLYNRLAPELVRLHCPGIPYWNSSPYGGAHAQDDAMGDKHHWHECMMHPDMVKRITPEEYDRVTAKFVSEYGYPGPCARESIEEYFGGAPIERDGDIWREHNNTFEKDTVLAGIEKHYRDGRNLTLDEYLLYASLCQGLMLGYSLEALRFNPNCWGSLYWMYDDTWGETGWTVIDYYLRRKPGYYFVKRAFDPVRLILRRQGEEVAALGVNDTGRSVAADIEYGWTAFDGSETRTASRHALLAARSRAVLWTFSPHSGGNGCVYARIAGRDAAPALLRERPFRELTAPPARVRIETVERRGDDCLITLAADTFAHAVHLNISGDARLSDHYFDMLPGERRTLALHGTAPEKLEVSALPLGSFPGAPR